MRASFSGLFPLKKVIKFSARFETLPVPADKKSPLRIRKPWYGAVNEDWFLKSAGKDKLN
ncbi:MAG: hypothetical protein BGO39_29605 [Chloroflexi bacterium 54-19]|nr:MAG: hypothetical protein BGO39_29605 [Chloroflexi bacterium 54-19]